jgi:hypothetical protein
MLHLLELVEQMQRWGGGGGVHLLLVARCSQQAGVHYLQQQSEVCSLLLLLFDLCWAQSEAAMVHQLCQHRSPIPFLLEMMVAETAERFRANCGGPVVVVRLWQGRRQLLVLALALARAVVVVKVKFVVLLHRHLAATIPQMDGQVRLT